MKRNLKFTNKKSMIVSLAAVALVAGVAFASMPHTTNRSIQQIENSAAKDGVTTETTPGGSVGSPSESKPAEKAPQPEQSSQPASSSPGSDSVAPAPAPAPAPVTFVETRFYKSPECIDGHTHKFWLDVYSDGSSQVREQVLTGDSCTVFHG